MTYLVPHGGCPGSIFYQETFSPLFCCRFVFLCKVIRCIRDRTTIKN